MSEASDLAHIIAHDLVPALWHHRGFFERPDGRKSEPQKAYTEAIRNRPDLLKVLTNFVTGLVDVLKRRARQLELSAGLQADACTILS